ncbi:hypothetical protein ACS7SF_12480 [Ralstonia sp. 25C]|uniref:hypothetical protein n=1 Tax=Ralstonia sp. 25C TaxID=3447363 RepID=UPI003F74D817
MTHPTPDSPDPRRVEAHAELYDKLCKLRMMLAMLYAGGFDHFKRIDTALQADYLCTCVQYAEDAYTAMLVTDGLAG